MQTPDCLKEYVCSLELGAKEGHVFYFPFGFPYNLVKSVSCSILDSDHSLGDLGESPPG